jgi:hypothetical protein
MQTRNAKTTVPVTSLISVGILTVSIFVISARLGPAAAGQDAKPSIEELRAGKTASRRRFRRDGQSRPDQYRPDVAGNPRRMERH